MNSNVNLTSLPGPSEVSVWNITIIVSLIGSGILLFSAGFLFLVSVQDALGNRRRRNIVAPRVMLPVYPVMNPAFPPNQENIGMNNLHEVIEQAGNHSIAVQRSSSYISTKGYLAPLSEISLDSVESYDDGE
uniref:uncharacterized protein LOC120330871 n=1 Tax=Styela clava TaxID=7725 RepID=UPI0019394044|nr:uncharacterized protein LOC120330871 [Styela clava]